MHQTTALFHRRTTRSVRQADGLDPVRALQRVLYRSAKQDPQRRFHALWSPLGEGVQDTRRRVDRAELDLPDADTVRHLLATQRLVVLGEDTVEIAHEALIDAWPRLHGWRHTDRETLRLHRQLN